MKNFIAEQNLFAVSAGSAEADINTEAALDLSLVLGLTDVPMALEFRSEDNSDEAHGKEEPDTIYRRGATAGGTYSAKRAQAQHFGLMLSYGLGACAPSAYGTGYKNVITPLESMFMPSMTGAFRLGDTVLKRRFASIFVDTLKATFAKDSWAAIEAGLKATGKYTDNMFKETVAGFMDDVSITLAANAVQGADAAARLDNVHQIRVTVPVTGEKQEVVYSAVSGATPAVITIAAPGGAHTACTFEVLYVPTEDAWCTFPARVIEPPLMVSDLVIKVGGKWNGAAFLGGRTYAGEVKSLEYSMNNQMAIEFRPGGSGDYASYAMRGGRTQTIAFNREFRDFILQQRMADNEYFGVYVKATGDEFETGKNYYAEGIFPRCAVLKAPLSVDGKLLAEAGDIRILEDDTYGSCIWTVANKQNGYAQ
ncbi:MAG: hypothetical protein EPN22_17000 [Nitrospirae bacterium]|nr:MAG: hypothetical protein EPN22_17000 [Nitrospirota bacterium]